MVGFGQAYRQHYLILSNLQDEPLKDSDRLSSVKMAFYNKSNYKGFFNPLSGNPTEWSNTLK